jgi:hypothetical protein
MCEIIPHDFGREKREAARRLTLLLKQSADRAAELERDPVRLFNIAIQEIADLHRQIQEAQAALSGYMPLEIDEPASSSSAKGVVRIAAADYKRLRRCAEIVRGMETLKLPQPSPPGPG